MENGSVQKGQNLLEDFVWPIDTGRLMGGPNYPNPVPLGSLRCDLVKTNYFYTESVFNHMLF